MGTALACPTTREDPIGLEVLLAEDHPINQKLAVRILESSGHRVTVVENGRQVLDSLEAGAFDVVLMDLQMPVMDGFEAVSRIRAQADVSRRQIPVIALTAHAMKGDRERCLAGGFDDYLSKPVRADALREAIGRVTRAVRKPEVLDRRLIDGLVGRCGGDLNFARDLLGSFLETAPLSAAGITLALRSGEASRLVAEAALSERGLPDDRGR